MPFKSAEFKFAAGAPGSFPIPGMPELMIAGRSNVGKSSLINALTGKRDLARVSKVPGKTAAAIYFLIDNKFFLVDLPGYGYAKRSKSERAGFAVLLNHYLANPHERRRALLLADGRHDPMEPDLNAAAWLHSKGLSCRLVLTKCDAVKPGELAARLRLMATTFNLPKEQIHPVSARTRDGIDALCKLIRSDLLPPARS